jgi:septum formation protein
MIGTKAVTLVLASSSPRRQELIRFLRLPVTVQVSDVDETVPDGWEPAVIVEELSRRKAEAAAELLPAESRNGSGRHIVIGSDTIVVLDGAVLGKPADRADAVRMLTNLQGRSHQVYSGVACLDISTGEAVTRHSVTLVHMKPLTGKQIAGYVDSGEPMDKAGAYGIQGLGGTLVDSIEGDYFTVVGLPLSLLTDMLSDMGVEVL